MQIGAGGSWREPAISPALKEVPVPRPVPFHLCDCGYFTKPNPGYLLEMGGGVGQRVSAPNTFLFRLCFCHSTAIASFISVWGDLHVTKITVTK